MRTRPAFYCKVYTPTDRLTRGSWERRLAGKRPVLRTSPQTSIARTARLPDYLVDRASAHIQLSLRINISLTWENLQNSRELFDSI